MRRRANRLRDDRYFRPRRRRRPGQYLPKLLLAALIGFSAWQWGHAGLVHAKAWLAPLLIDRAWYESQRHATEVKPWPWADTWPVARLSVPTQGIERYVLSGANGASLPFGPGHMTGTALPGESGTIVIAGHRGDVAVDRHLR